MTKLAHAIIMLSLAAVFSGCSTTESTPTADTKPSVVYLEGKEAYHASRGQIDAVCFDILPDGRLVWDDAFISREQFKTELKSYVVDQGKYVACVRMLKDSPEETFDYVLQAARDAGITRIEVAFVNLDGSVADKESAG